jgi:hypothetical protein
MCECLKLNTENKLFYLSFISRVRPALTDPNKPKHYRKFIGNLAGMWSLETVFSLSWSISRATVVLLLVQTVVKTVSIKSRNSQCLRISLVKSWIFTATQMIIMNLHLKYKLHGYESMSDLLRFLFQFTMIGISLYQLSAPFYGKSLANYLDLEGCCLVLRG